MESLPLVLNFFRIYLSTRFAPQVRYNVSTERFDAFHTVTVTQIMSQFVIHEFNKKLFRNNIIRVSGVKITKFSVVYHNEII